MLLISYNTNNKAVRQFGLLLHVDDNRGVSKACVTRPLVKDCNDCNGSECWGWT